ncbi:E3 ubiquitin-protein ligase bre-1 [Caenorhabditis elegans]|uniref:E3 ubiquitin-protein ligase bre-1 n=1 Tax=Caenorhabditis elegans TaxID=6239 RepID=BRE1_CAEEL|nr:E3 ubiquitin-protein ligase bre-1 [Caenorhabditis elegans]P34537.2 RecName: Full=E3 ubiquitin-protein ligase bre-1; AltName: Full=RING finger protein rfp-1; AltName: Full=RING-type E3 ubiquitin transferase bre-1 [Caenorhabditis elegans]CCD73191.1 E3 ubiquitin-protein ligase bre-1 [Caenorhabditis elegans]|eukprot:NP_001022700.1 E3 ubiquitin-protein ligase bre-1 [Caenorhabditis elegans]
MMKRSNEGIGGENYASSPSDDGQQKRRKIQFEPVRMPAVSNVNDIRARAVVYQTSKLKQQLLYKNKRIAELEKENERSKRRQQTDESNFLKVYNMFSDIEKYICTQTKNEFGEYIGGDTAPTGIDVLGMTNETYNKFFDQAKQNLRNAFVSYAKARHDRAHESTIFIDKLKTLIDSPTFNPNGVHKELTAKAASLAIQNEKLQSEVTKVQSDCYNLERKKRILTDKLSVQENRVQELEHQLEDARFETDKHMRLANKFEYKLATLVSEGQSGGNGGATPSSSGTTNATEKKISAPDIPPSETAAKEIENLRLERDEQESIASRRLQDLEEMNKKVQTLTQENSKLRLETQTFFSVDSIVNSEEYKNLKKYYSLAIKEYERVSKDLEDITTERDAFRSAKEARAMLMSEEHQKTLKEIQCQSDIHNSFYKVSHDSEVLRCEFETVKEEYNKTVKQSEWDEMKATLNTLRSMNRSLKSEKIRLREKDKQSQKDINTLKSELTSLKEAQDKCLLVPLEDVSNAPPEDVNKIRQEYESLCKEVKRLGAMEKQEKQKQVENLQKEVNRQIADKLSELETLRKTNEMLTNDEECISDELEAIGTAVEEEQERNAQLYIEKREQEDRNLKMMNDRMIQNQTFNRLREKLSCLESKAQTDAQIAKMHEFEKKANEELVTKLSESVQFKSAELTRLTNLMEQHRKNIQEVGMSRDENQIKADRCEGQMKQIQELYAAKAREIEDFKFKRQRAEEELETLRIKYERVKRNESVPAQSGDQVLEEANRQMKETLTCPSCKTRPKDCIMLKCYHLFCETCIKTMYDTRQRKCPKCNSNFGANDFHRIFI